jgi:hypothetical protein
MEFTPRLPFFVFDHCFQSFFKPPFLTSFICLFRAGFYKHLIQVDNSKNVFIGIVQLYMPNNPLIAHIRVKKYHFLGMFFF